jgi:WD40 repeat protein
LQAHSNAVTSIEFSSDCARLATGTAAGELRVWKWPDFRPLLGRALGRQERITKISDMAFTQDNSVLAVAAGDIHLISLTGKPDRRVEAGGYVPCLGFSSDGSMLAAGLNAEVRIWDLKSLRVIHRLQKGRGDASAVSFSPDGTRILASDDSATWLWDLATGRDLGRFQRLGSFPFSRFQEDGNTVVLQWKATDGTYTTEVLRTPTWAEIAEKERLETRPIKTGTK